MRTTVSRKQTEKYRTDGFLHYPDLLDRREVIELRDSIAAAIATMGRRKVAGEGADMEDGDEFYDRVFTQRLNLWRISDTIHSYVANPGIGRMISELTGVTSFRIWHDQALIKEPFANHTALHTDIPFWSFYSESAISIWIALEDTTVANGCLCFMPGTHRRVTFQRTRINEEFGNIFQFYPELRGIEPVPVEMKAGDCSFHNGLVIHGAGVNMTTSRRIAMSCAYMPDGSVFNGQQNILPASYVRSLEIGQPLDDDTINPVVPIS